ncbi:MAG: glycogen debranching N-terminal domain-containing protein [Acidimicrobiia bacterium]
MASAADGGEGRENHREGEGDDWVPQRTDVLGASPHPPLAPESVPEYEAALAHHHESSPPQPGNDRPPAGTGGPAPWTAAVAAAHNTTLDAVTLVDGTTFSVSAGTGDMSGSGHHGLFMFDTRVLSRFELRVAGETCEPLTVIPNGPFSAAFVGRVTFSRTSTTPDERSGVPSEGTDPTATLVVVRSRHTGHGMREDLELRNTSTATLEFDVSLHCEADFASLFDVKQGKVAARPLSITTPTADGLEIADAADGTPGVRIVCHPAPAHDMSWNVRLEPGSKWSACIEISARPKQRWLTPTYRCGDEVSQAISVTRLRSWRGSAPQLFTSDRALLRAFERSIEDIGALRLFDPDHPDRVVVAAGAPWFMTLFGRDSLLTAWMTIFVDQSLARGVLHALADLQGVREDRLNEEQPGRILHEVRYDEQTALALGGHNAYYGTIDATPLFVMLAAELWRWTGNHDDVARLLPHVDRALAWIERYGDADGDGYVEYERLTPSGLANQGWKDSWDGVRYHDGSVAHAPIALCEVQAYVYGAYAARATLASVVGDQRGVRHWQARADELKARFNRDFWMPEHGTYAVGLDAEKRPIDSITSNPGHCLWTGIVTADRAASVARSLLGADLSSGFGLRTLTVSNPGYDPLSYHCGSVWPHDTAIAVSGLARYGLRTEAERLAGDLVDASSHVDGRLPELFAGFARDDLGAPVPYPTSCSPQAWSAAATLLVVRSLLRLEPDLRDGVVRWERPSTARFADLRIRSVPMGGHRLELVEQRGENPG